MIDDAISALTEALTSKKLDWSKLVLRTDNGSQCISVKFGSVVKAYDIKQEFIHCHIARTELSCRIIPQESQKGIRLAVRF